MKIEKFVWKDDEMQLSQCVFCKHLIGNARCAAFRAGIPMKIRTNEHDHRKSFPGDNGIRFEPLEGKQ
jgi:hypothetical protein